MEKYHVQRANDQRGMTKKCLIAKRIIRTYRYKIHIKKLLAQFQTCQMNESEFECACNMVDSHAVFVRIHCTNVRIHCNDILINASRFLYVSSSTPRK